MSIDHAGATAGTLPPCPSWCTLPAGHDTPVIPLPTTDDIRREHATCLLDDREVGIVEVVRLDEILAGAVFTGAALVDVDQVNTHLGPDEALRLAEALARAAVVAERDRAAQLSEAGAR